MKWRAVNNQNNFELSDFEVSDSGLIRNKNTGKYLKQYRYSIKEGGVRLKVFVPSSNKGYLMLDVANLIADTYLDKLDNKNIVDFKDGDALNCDVSNLYYRGAKAGRGYFKQKYSEVDDDYFIQNAIKEYRKIYPNDNHITDEDLEQEFRLKIYTNKEKGVSRTMHFKIYMKTIHNMNGGEQNDISISNYDDYRDGIESARLSECLDKVDDLGYLKDRLLYCLDNTLTERESIVLKFRYGLLPSTFYKDNTDYNEDCCSNLSLYSFGEIGKYMGVTRENKTDRIKSIKKIKTLIKIR